MIVIVGLLFVFFGGLLVYPSLWKFGKSLVYVIGKIVSYYWPVAKAGAGTAYTTVEKKVESYYYRLLWTVSGYFAWLVLITVMAIGAALGGYTTWFAIFCFSFALSLWPIQKQFASLARLSQTYLPDGLRFSEPKLTSILIVVALDAGVTAILFPSFFFNGYGAAILVTLMAGTAWVVAFPSPQLYAVKAFAITIALTIAFWGVFWLMPATAEAAMLKFRSFELGRGQDNLIAKLNERPVQKVISESGVFGWQVETYSNGTPVLDDNGFAKVSECKHSDGSRFTLAKDAVFKTFDLRVSADAGEPLVQVFIPNTDGTWIQNERSPKCWIPVSKTDLAVAKPKPTPVPVTTPTVVAPSQPAPAKVVAVERSFYMQASEVYRLGIHVRRGQRVQITASGQINTMPEDRRADRAYRWVGPDGWGSSIPGFITKATGSFAGPLPEGAPYLALAARVSSKAPSLSDGNWILIGSNNSFIADQDGYLYLVVNEKSKNQAGIYQPEWLSNNQGGLQIEVSVL